MAYIPLALNFNTRAQSSVSGTSSTSLYQTATTGDKILVLFNTDTRGGSHGTAFEMKILSLTNCTAGTVRSVGNNTSRHYFCWITITGNDWTFQAREKSLETIDVGDFHTTLTWYHRITVSDDQQSGAKIDSTNVQASEMTGEFSSGQHRQGLSLYRSGNNATPNTHAHHGIPENAGEIKYSQFSNAFRHRTATQNDQSGAANRADGSMTNLASMVFTAGVDNTLVSTQSAPKGNTLYSWDIDHGYADSSSGYSALGSVSNGGRVSGLGDHPRDNGAFFSRIASYWNGTSSNNSPPNPSYFQLRLHSLENSSGFEGTGRTSTGGGSASSSVAGWNKLFIVEVDNAASRYTLLDIDSATTTNYTNSGNDYSDIVWTSGGFTMSSGKEYMMMFVK